MKCTVYCLLQSAQDLRPLLERLRKAGIPIAETTIVQRGEASSSLVEAGNPAQWWTVPLGPAALWWAVLHTWPGAVRKTAPPRESDPPDRHAVISLSRYRVVRMIVP